MPEKCNFCDNVYSIKSNRARHERTVHADEKGIPVYRCSIVQLLAVNYLKFKVTPLTAMVDLQNFVIM